MDLASATNASLERLQASGRLLVGCSGGPDSTALVHVLHGLARPLTVAHLHHRMRGSDADRDADFVRDLAARLALPLALARLDRPPPSEAAARAARFAFFADAAARTGAHAVVLAHTRDDQVETVLLRVLRGAGLRGLRGMSPSRLLAPASPVLVLRPWLDFPKASLLAYLAARGLPHRADASNRDPRFLRNRVRLTLLPALRELVPGLDESLLRIASSAARAAPAVRAAARAALESSRANGGWDALRLLALEPALRHPALEEACRAAAPGYVLERRGTETLERVLRLGTRADLPRGLRADARGGALRLLRKTTPPAPDGRGRTTDPERTAYHFLNAMQDIDPSLRAV
jgi:tRNA(Ile)-lysidine synthase